MQISHYLSASGRDPLQRWLDGLGDVRCRLAVLRRIDRLAMGNLGDERFCRDGVWELRIEIHAESGHCASRRDHDKSSQVIRLNRA